MNSRYQLVKISETESRFDFNYSVLDTETGLYLLEVPNQWVGGEYIWASLETVIAENGEWNNQQAEMIVNDLNKGSIEAMREQVEIAKVNKLKRTITPHKGNRDQNVIVRLTQAEKLLFTSAAEKCDMSQADFLMFATRFYINSKHFARAVKKAELPA